MPLQNRVDPWGRLNAVPSKAATVMGNRGILHDGQRRIVKKWAHKNWIACDPTYRSIDRTPLFQPSRYSELFFLDEATAFAAGHRPCNYCQHARFASFREAWKHAYPTSSLNADEMDAQIHADRVLRNGTKVTFQAALTSLPEGTFVELNEEAFLVHGGNLWKWSFDGYLNAALAEGSEVTVLTPRCIVDVFRAGLRPGIHKTVASISA